MSARAPTRPSRARLLPQRARAGAPHFESLLASGWIPSLLIGIGVVLRVARFIDNRSLWLDESTLALNIVNRSFGQLLDPLSFEQGAPAGFLAAEKLAIKAFGDSEYALRLPPLLAGLVALILFWLIARRLLPRPAAILALAFYVVLEPLIYYSTELKQYSFDVAVALGLIYLALVLRVDQSRRVLQAFALGIAGAALMWLSFSSVFALAGIGIGLSVSAAARRDWPGLRTLVIPAGLWLTSFAAFYAVSIGDTSDVQRAIFREAEGTATQKLQIFKNLFGIYSYPGGMARSLVGLAVVVAVVGSFALYRTQRAAFFVFAAMAAVTLAAAAIGKYPFTGRFVLFLLPLALLVLAQGAEEIRRGAEGRFRLFGVALILLLLGPISAEAAANLVRPPGQEEIKPVLSYLDEHWQAGDVLYVHWPSQFAFRYYLECSDCGVFSGKDRPPWQLRPRRLTPNDRDNAMLSNPPELIIGLRGIDAVDPYLADLDQIPHEKRVWFLFSHTITRGGIAEGPFFLVYLDHIGKRLAEFKRTGSAVYLYDLR